MNEQTRSISLTVNGEATKRQVSTRRLLTDFLRYDVGLTGTHVGCEHGVCGCCTILLNGRSARACLTLAVQTDGSEVTTIEGLSRPGDELHPVQRAFAACHGLQCGFCTPGFVMSVVEVINDGIDHDADESVIREAIAGNLCRCTGYQGIVDAVRMAAREMSEVRKQSQTVPAAEEVKI